MSRLSRRHFLKLGSLSALAAACRPRLDDLAGILTTPTPTPSPPGPSERVTAYLRAWELADYPAMHRLLSTEAADRFDLQAFADRHRAIAREAGLEGLQARAAFAQIQTDGEATVGVELTFRSRFVGQIPVRNRYPLIRQGQDWVLDWSPALVFPQLEGERLVHLLTEGSVRGDIYDRSGLPLATRGTQVTVGVVPARIEDEATLLETLSPVVGLSRPEIVARYTKAGSQPEWFMPVADLPAEAARRHWETLSGLSGVELREKYQRQYPNGPLAGHVVGYVGPITAEELALLQARGYGPDDLVGKAGLERWGESYLAGRRSATLAAVEPAGGVAAVIKRRPGVPSRSLHTSLYLTLQRAAEEALSGVRGAVVALDPGSGEIIALASSPGFDPNRLAAGLSTVEWRLLTDDASRPLVNRATLGAYPTGSVFKIVTAAAALEAGGYTPHTTIHCSGAWQAVGRTWLDWRAHGPVNVRSALAQSCNVFFYQAGLQLNQIDPGLLPRFARAFGLGQPTDLRELPEAEGLVPDEAWKRATLGEPWFAGDAINFAIGQGAFLATPLQIARMVAAVANGGSLYRPRLVRAVSGAPGVAEELLGPQVMSRLPVSASTLWEIRAGLGDVTGGNRGTAAHVFRGFPVTTGGKTGSAQNPAKEPHAWFVGWLPYEDPHLAMAVLVEEAGEGSEVAAPIFRRLAEAYLGIEPPSE